MTSIKKVFLTIYLPIALILLGAFYFNYNIMARDGGKLFNTAVQDKWNLIDTLIKDNTCQTIQDVSSISRMRITIIDPQGIVINDSAVSCDNVSSMQNHSLRDEIRLAFYNTPSYSYRNSPTTGEKTFYYAKKRTNGNVLRVSESALYIDKIKKDTLINSVAIFAAILLLSALIAVYIARKISVPIKQLKEFAQAMDSNKQGYTLPNFTDKAINDVAEVIYKTKSKLAKEKKATDMERTKLNTIFASMDEGIILINDNGEVAHSNAQATDILGIKIKKGLNLISDLSDVESIIFFKQIIEDDQPDHRRVEFKNMLFELYSKKIGNQVLLVFHEITDKFKYETFKTELIGNITHEIKTPLTLLMGASETILKDENMDEDIRKRFIETIHRNSNKLNNIINDTLELHKLESVNKIDDIEEKTDLPALLKDIVLIPQENGTEVVYNIDKPKLGVYPEHLESLLANLINNAFKYSTGNQIFVDIKEDKNKTIISVADLGPVIPEKERKRIFERFYTVSKSRDRAKSGSGLGLSIVKHIAALYGGKVTVYENPLGGNTFEVTLKEKQVKKEV